MAFFRKNKSSTTDIPELQEYYASQKTENTAVAWVLALGSLLITVAVLVGLFAGGRWIYRAVTKDDTKTTTSTVDTTTVATQTATTDSSTSTDNSAAVQNNPTTTVPDTSSAIGSSIAPGVSPSQTAQANQSAVAATTQIPNTGPGSVLVMFATIVVGAYALHRSFLLRKN